MGSTHSRSGQYLVAERVATSEHVDDLAVWVDPTGLATVVIPSRVLAMPEEIDLVFTCKIAASHRREK